MRWSDLLRVAVLLAALLVASAAGAVTPISDLERSTSRQAIAQQLDSKHAFALVLGISDFDNPSWPKLNGVKSEVEAIRTVLQRQGFTLAGTPEIGRLDHAQLKAAIEEFFRSYGNDPSNRLVVYVATHGYSDPSIPHADGYLVASDAGTPDNGRLDNGYSVDELSAALTSVAAQHIFLFFDSCFSGAMLPEPTRGFDSVLAGKPELALSKETVGWTLNLLAHNARLVLTAGDATEKVPDSGNPFPAAIIDALNGAADVDGDGLILGTEIAQYVRSRVARETRLMGNANDPVFAVLPKIFAPANPRPDVPEPDRIDYALQGDFVFLTPSGAKPSATRGISEQEEMLKAKTSQLAPGEFLACVDCPTMVKLPGAPNLALSSTEITYAEWDACFREMGCHRYLGDDGFGRGDRPAGGVTWLDALEYVTWLETKGGKDAPCIDVRLPTADEWNYAALYGTAGQVTWAAAVADGQPICWGCGSGEDGEAAVRTASEPANPAGLFDMVGNLWEWVNDDGGVCDLTRIRQSGQCTPGRVMGGSYATDVRSLSTIAEGGTVPRTGNDQPWSSPTIGFRVACDVRPQG